MKHQEGMELRIGEMVIMLDYPESKDWYVAEISQVLHDRFTVNGYITRDATLGGYRQASRKLRLEALKGVVFHRTWCKDKGKGVATTIPPKHLKGLENYLWKWRLPIKELDQLLLVRNVGLDAHECLCKASRIIATSLSFPHHVGAGGEESASKAS